jgi:hypothetical protein
VTYAPSARAPSAASATGECAVERARRHYVSSSHGASGLLVLSRLRLVDEHELTFRQDRALADEPQHGHPASRYPPIVNACSSQVLP